MAEVTQLALLDQIRFLVMLLTPLLLRVVDMEADLALEEMAGPEEAVVTLRLQYQ